MLHFHSTERYCCVAIKSWPKPCNLCSQPCYFWFMPTWITAVTQQSHWSKNSKSLKNSKLRNDFFFLWCHYATFLVVYLFKFTNAIQMSSVVVWQMKSWVASAHFPKSHCKLRVMELSFLGCLFYVSSDLLFRGKKNLCWYISPSNKPKIGLGFYLNIYNSPFEDDRKLISIDSVCFCFSTQSMWIKLSHQFKGHQLENKHELQ